MGQSAERYSAIARWRRLSLDDAVDLVAPVALQEDDVLLDLLVGEVRAQASQAVRAARAGLRLFGGESPHE